jgi:hypothetical protein
MRPVEKRAAPARGNEVDVPVFDLVAAVMMGIARAHDRNSQALAGPIRDANREIENPKAADDLVRLPGSIGVPV